MEKFLEIFSNNNSSGIHIKFQGIRYSIIFDKKIWQSTPDQTREALKDNLALVTTMHLPLIYNKNKVIYYSGRPLLEPYLLQNFLKDIPSCTEVDRLDTDEIIRQFLNIDFHFNDQEIVYPSDKPVKDSYKALVGMSFGKDSLLTYAVAQEINLDPEIIYVIEQSLTYEEKHKRALSEEFKKEFNKDLKILVHETGRLRDYNYLGLPKLEFGWGLQNTEYALEFIPFAYTFKGKYIFFGNEQTTAASYMDKTNRWQIFPAYDQSHLWTLHINQITQAFSGRTVQTGSLIEPLMDMMIQYILVHRYPTLAKYQMSCFTENEFGKNYHWCHHCSVCAKMYLLCVGSGIDPKLIGLKNNMLEKDFKRYFTLFGGKSSLTYANTDVARDEQLFAFYSAAKKGIKADLINYFKESELFQEAKNREDELFTKFCSIYDPISLPKELKSKVLSIYKEELSSFEL
ncbi:MAG: hypothetical protein ACFE8M_10950 [Candidatus Hermodarchaeota archaeon]